MKKYHPIFYGWFIVATGMLVTSLGYGARYSFSVIFPALLEYFHWPRDITAVMLSVHLLVYGLIAPVAGGLVDRIGPRKIMVFGAIVLALGLALSGYGNEPWHFYLSFGVLSGMGLCFIGAMPFTAVLRNWFERRRGLALSLLFLGSGIGWASYPVVALLITSVGWRNTFFVEAIIVAAVVVPVTTFVVRYHPRDKCLTRDSTPLNTESSTVVDTMRIRDQTWVATEWTLTKAVRTSRFWLLCLATFSVWGITEHIMVAHHIAFAIDVGFQTVYASSVLALFGIMSAVGSLASLVSDRIGRETTITIGTLIGISGIIILILIEDTSQPWMLYYYAITLGFGLGIISPTIAATTTDIFQGPRVGAIIGFVWFSFSMGGAIGPWLGGWIFETTGSYVVAFLVAILLFAISCIAIWLAGPRKIRSVAGRVNSARFMRS